MGPFQCSLCCGFLTTAVRSTSAPCTQHRLLFYVVHFDLFLRLWRWSILESGPWECPRRPEIDRACRSVHVRIDVDGVVPAGVQLLQAVDFPLTLPVEDLSRLIKGKKERMVKREADGCERWQQLGGPTRWV